VNGAKKKVVEIDGLPEMPIAGLRLMDIVGSGKVGLTARYTDGLELHRVQVNAEDGPAFTVDTAANLELDGVTTRKPIGLAAVLRLSRTPGAIVRNSRAFPGTKTFLSTGPGELKSIHLEGNLLENAGTATEER
jgi:hypothetical protein